MSSVCQTQQRAQVSRDAELLQTTTHERGLLLPRLPEHKQVSQNSIAAITRTNARVKDADADEVPLPSASVVSELTQENLNTVLRLWGTARLSVAGNGQNRVEQVYRPTLGTNMASEDTSHWASYSKLLS